MDDQDPFLVEAESKADGPDPIELIDAMAHVRILDLDELTRDREDHDDLIIAAAWPPSPHGGW